MRMYIKVCMYIRRPRPMPRQGWRLGPPEVWNVTGRRSFRLAAVACCSHEPFGPQPSGFTGFWDCRLAALRCSKSSAAATRSVSSHSHLFSLHFETAVWQP